MNPKLASGVDLSDQIELIVATQLEETKEQKSQTDIKFEQY